MNNGKLCISVGAETIDELIPKIAAADELADVIEVRFDHLSGKELDLANWETASQKLKHLLLSQTDTPWITTLRVKEQGGRRELNNDERNNFWNSGNETEYGDFEEDILEGSFDRLWSDRICSYHDMIGPPDDLEAIYSRLALADADIIKIAYHSQDATDAIPVWKLLDRAGGRKLIPIAMGEAGKWTRVLGLAHGAFLTYAALDNEGETAPGQLTASEMIDVYRVKELDLETKVYGVIGDPVSSSLSPVIHNTAFAASGINAVFIPLLVHDLEAFMRRMVITATREVELNFGGFAVTMPHKREIIKHLDEIDPIAEAVGAVNTVNIVGGKLIGHNTDLHGFIDTLKRYFGDLHGTSVAIIGSGGAARACIYGLKHEKTEVTIFARDETKARTMTEQFGTRSFALSKFKDESSRHSNSQFDIVVNATPVGMHGKLEEQTPITADELAGVKFVFDLVTRAGDTPLIREAKMAGVPAIGGFEMLLSQGMKQFEIWTGQTAPEEIMRDAIFKHSKEAGHDR